MSPPSAASGPVDGTVPDVRSCVSNALFDPPPNDTVVWFGWLAARRVKSCTTPPIALAPNDAAAAGLKTITGVRVDSYSGENGPAQAAGLQVGDIIISIDGKPMSAALFAGQPGRAALVLGHGAGGDRRNPLLTGLASRLAAAGWVRSYIREAAQRELLFDLETARRRLFDREGKTADGDLLAKCAANLLRLWCED